eukprot:m.137317 g.137317  ORF g.137317 m.137317 type:complete len:67 (-) comp23984_c0_seq20:55-255(-)
MKWDEEVEGEDKEDKGVASKLPDSFTPDDQSGPSALPFTEPPASFSAPRAHLMKERKGTLTYSEYC